MGSLGLWVPAHLLLGGSLVAEGCEPAGIGSICLISECWRRYKVKKRGVLCDFATVHTALWVAVVVGQC